MYDDHGKRKYTVAQIGQTFGVSRKTVYRYLDRDQPAAEGATPVSGHCGLPHDGAGVWSSALRIMQVCGCGQRQRTWISGGLIVSAPSRRHIRGDR
ncbi:terminase gpP N-terminus-related DNA-binding protein [Saccharopolyspora sp. 5N708]|uniref:terminase gpP N-terminus-related DNA-binding protein n=1 Tax=Saccharopolyspora sp. 5N708 TaxID=3457424 RepID=UPI003FD22061